MSDLLVAGTTFETYEIFFKISQCGYPSIADAAGKAMYTTVYTREPIAVGTELFADAKLTIPLPTASRSTGCTLTTTGTFFNCDARRLTTDPTTFVIRVSNSKITEIHK